MNIRQAFTLAVGSLLPLAFVVFFSSVPGSSNSTTQIRGAGDEARTVLAQLGEAREKLSDGSAEARQLDRTIARVRRKAMQTERRAENPGAFLEALADVKTNADGTTYAHNYKVQALESAQRLKRKAAAPLPWVERGPGNVSGRSRALIVDAADPSGNTWLVATVGGGIWKTTNAGQSWQDKTPALTTLSTTCIAQCTSQPAVIYAGTGMGYGRIVDLEGSGIWKSIDGGNTWSQLASTASGELFDAINRIVVDPDDPDVLVVCGNNQFSHLGPNGGSRESGIFRSTDGGVSWTQTFDPSAVFSNRDNRVQQIVTSPVDFDVQYATVNEVGVVKSIDGGITWTTSTSSLALASDIGNPPGNGFGLAGISVRIEMAVAPSDPNRLYAAVERPRGVGDLYYSKDAGASWMAVTDLSGDPNWFNAFGVSGSTGSYTAGWFNNTIAVHPYDEDVVFVGGVNLYRMNINPSNNTRTSSAIGWWIPNAQGIPVVHADHHFLVMIPGNEQTQSFRIVDANDGGLGYSTAGGANFVQITGLGTTQFYGADKSPGFDAYIGGMQDNGTWQSAANPNANSPWSFDIGGDGFEVAWHGTNANLLLGGSQFGNLSRSADGGQSWAGIPDARAGNAPFITKIANDKTDPDLVFAVGDQGVKRSDDFGLSWTLTPLPNPWLGYRPFDNVEISIAQPQNVWVTSRTDVDPPSGQAGGIYVSVDGGLSFSPVHANLPPSVTESSGLATHPLDADTAYLLFSRPGQPKILRTTDLGQGFEDLSGFSGLPRSASKSLGGVSPNGFPDVAVFSLLVMPFDTDQIWAGTEIGLFMSDDGGATWSVADNGLPNVAVFQLRIVENQVIAATQGRGIWSVTLPELAGHQPPMVTRVPRLNEMVMLPTGSLAIDIDLRSPYDSTVVELDGTHLQTIPANAEVQNFRLEIPVTVAATRTASVVAYREGRAYRTPQRSVDVFPAVAQRGYVTDFDAPSEATNWAGNGFSIRTQISFPSPAVHSDHPYFASTDLIYRLKAPIEVAPTNAWLRYRDVCLVEEGVVLDWTNPNFFDYVVVEATKDGANWVALAPGYDSRANPAWLSAYRNGLGAGGDSSTPGSANLYVEHAIDLHQSFAPGDVIFVRFRLHSDPAAIAWGWAIDDLRIQPAAVGILDEEDGEGDGPSRPLVTALSQNVPNPFNPSTEIEYSLARESRIRLEIFDLRGRLIRSLVDPVAQPAGTYRVRWHGDDENGTPVASGQYFYRLRTDGRVLSRKMLLVK